MVNYGESIIIKKVKKMVNGLGMTILFGNLSKNELH